MHSPLVSVVIPCFQVWTYLAEALQSVFDQTYENFEIWIVNDGCPSAAALKSMQEFARKPKVRTLTIEHQGPVLARNKGIERASGRYIVCLDADDRLHPEYLAKSVKILESDPGIGLVSPLVHCFGTQAQTPGFRPFSPGSFLVGSDCVLASMFRREDWQRVGGLDPQFEGYEGYDFFHELLKIGRRFHQHSEVLFQQRKHPQAVTAQRGFREDLAVRSALLRKHRSLYIEHLEDIILEACKDRREIQQQQGSIDMLNEILRTAKALPAPRPSLPQA